MRNFTIFAVILCFTKVPHLQAHVTDPHIIEIKNYVEDCTYYLAQADNATRRSTRNPKGINIYFEEQLQRITIEMNIHFRLESFVGEREQHLRSVTILVNEALREVESFYQKHYLHLNINATYDFSQSYMPSPTPENSRLVYLRPYRYAMNTLRWGLNPRWSHEDRAKIYAHELTHFFGLLDEYKKAHGLNMTETLGEEDSFMRNWNHPEAKMYPRHIREILSDLCS